MSRLFEIRKYFRLTQKQLAEILGIGQNTVSMIESGQISLVERNRRALVEKLKINANWLDSGSGQMIMSDQPFDTGLLSDYIIPTPAIQGQG
ncbi:MAG: helix-turn-helix transcriptional regulator, partial [Mucinivorans sp.]